jgi:hypothetical protein
MPSWVTIKKWITAAAVAAASGAIAVAPGYLEDGTINQADLLAMGAAAIVALRLWFARQAADLGVLVNLTDPPRRRTDDSPADFCDGESLVYKVMLEPKVTGQFLTSPEPVEIRRFTDERLQAAVERVFTVAEQSGHKNGMVFQATVKGEFRFGVAVKKGGHLTFGGFLEKRPGRPIEGLAEVAWTF